jgi:hypothetical protein
MNEPTLDTELGHDRLALRAVLVHEDADIEAALAAAGIHNPVKLAVRFMGDGEAVARGAPIGGGTSPDLSAILVEQADSTIDRRHQVTDAPTGKDTVSGLALSPPNAAGPSNSRSMAPIRRRL